MTRKPTMKAAFVLTATLGALLAVSPAAAEEAKTATMYKPLQCGCCDEYAKYLEENGFKVNVESVPDRQFEIVKRMAEVPERFYGCHTLAVRSEEHTSELQSLMRISYAVFCLKKK